MSNKHENDTLITRTAFSCEKTDSENTKEDFAAARNSDIQAKAFDDRSTEVLIRNTLPEPDYTLILYDYEVMSGKWTKVPPFEIKNNSVATFRTTSTGWLTGTSGWVMYRCPQDSGYYSFLWRNPYAGKNSYETQSGTYRGKIIKAGGLGENATVIFTLVYE